MHYNSIVADPMVRPQVLSNRVDLLASNVRTLGTNQYVIFSFKVPANQVLVVKSMAFWAQERINPGTDDESFRSIDPKDGNDFFAFAPLVDGNSPFGNSLVYNAPKIAAAPSGLNNLDQARLRGITTISLNPWFEVQESMDNEILQFVVGEGKELQIVFSIIPVSTVDGLPTAGQYTIGVDAVKRVDFAGAMIAGILLGKQEYQRMERQMERERSKG